MELISFFEGGMKLKIAENVVSIATILILIMSLPSCVALGEKTNPLVLFSMSVAHTSTLQRVATA